MKLLAPLAAMVVPRAVRRTIERSFLADLVRRDQIVEWMLPRNWAQPVLSEGDKRAYEQDTRAIIGALLAPAFEMRTVDGLALTCDLEKPRVQEILGQCAAAEGVPYQVWQSDWFDREDSRLVCLLSDQPNWLKRHLGQSHAGSLFFAVKTDPPVPKVPLDAVIAA